MPKNEMNNIDSLQIKIASPDTIRKWSYGEVKSAKTIKLNKNGEIEDGGLFCQKIFGPVKDDECKCGKYKTFKNRGHICEECGVEVTSASVRRERMGHIELAVPVVNWLFYKKGYIRTLLDMKEEAIKEIINYNVYVVLESDIPEVVPKSVLTYDAYKTLAKKYGFDSFRVGTGSEAIKELLNQINVEEEINVLKDNIHFNENEMKKRKMVKQLEILEAFHNSGNELEWMIMDVIPVIPPDLRPMIQLDGGKYANSDLNEFYVRIITRNERIKNLKKNEAPDQIIYNECKTLQRAVDALMANEFIEYPITKTGSRNNRQVYKSLINSISGKEGLFRKNLLGKSVDYSGRSVIVVGPNLKLYQCGIPKDIAIELFKPFVMYKLIEKGIVSNLKKAKEIVENKDECVWNLLEEVIKGKTVMLNRAPTLHRLGMQAFEPVLVSGNAIKLHPLVCPAFNADFDGDQMAIHLALSDEAQQECKDIMLSTKNLLKPSDGEVIAVPSQDMVLGMYYLTMEKYNEITAKNVKAVKRYSKNNIEDNIANIKKDLSENTIEKDDPIKIKIRKNNNSNEYKEIITTPISVIGKKYKCEEDVFLDYDNGVITLHQPIYIERSNEYKGEVITEYIRTTLGRIIFNSYIPQNLGFIDRDIRENVNQYELNTLIGKKEIKKILNACMEVYGMDKLAVILDDIKTLGFKYSTISGITVSVDDMTMPVEKEKMINKSQDLVDDITKLYKKGHLTDDERYNSVIKVWDSTDKELTKALMKSFDKYNNIFIMADSGARGSEQQIKQLSGMRGMMADTSGNTIEYPIKANFREGLNALEYFMSAHGARKGMTDTALKTSDSGYLSRKLTVATQDIIIRYDDCKEKEVPGIYISAIVEGNEIIETLQERITGRYVAENIYDLKGNIIAEEDTCVTKKLAEEIISNGIDSLGEPFYDKEKGRENDKAKIKIRSIMSCKAPIGLCQKCYGIDNATGNLVKMGTPVGILAAQSIGEPGTQLTMRTFHTGGVAGGGDITQGLPRIEEIFEASRPKGEAILSEMEGRVEVFNLGKTDKVIILDDINKVKKEYDIPFGSTLAVKTGDYITIGDKITVGSCNLSTLVNLKGLEKTQDYIITEVQRVYRLQGVEISDKHIEMFIHEMLKKVKVDDPGDSSYNKDQIIYLSDYNDGNEMLVNEGKRPIKAHHIVMGLTKISCNSDSFLAAASFQQTSSILAEAAVKGKVDPLIGIKENVIIGRKIPAGTGYHG